MAMSESQHVGPIIFANETARSQLVDEGIVTSFRTRDRTTGDTWWRESRTGEKRGDVHVEKVARVRSPITVQQLGPYADRSGFDSARDWLDAIVEVHGQPVGDYDSEIVGYIYEVTER